MLIGLQVEFLKLMDTQVLLDQTSGGLSEINTQKKNYQPLMHFRLTHKLLKKNWQLELQVGNTNSLHSWKLTFIGYIKCLKIKDPITQNYEIK